jgi:hypothetical protein
MVRPRIFLGSSGKQQRLLKSLTSGLASVADVEPWTTVFNPGVNTLDRLVELTREVDFAAFVFAQDDWTSPTSGDPTSGDPTSGDPGTAVPGMASPRDNVVFEAGLFGGALGMRRTFILHANDAKLPTDLLGLTVVRYPPTLTPAELKEINQKVRSAIEAEGRLARIEGDWWQYALTARSELEPSTISLLRITRDRAGGVELTGRGWQEDGTLSSRYWSEASKERTDPASVFYFHRGERPRHADVPQFQGTGEIRLESTDRALGYYTIRTANDPGTSVRTSGVYLRADPQDWAILDSGSGDQRRALIAERLRDWDAQANS